MLRSCESQATRAAMIRIRAGVVPTARSHLLVSNARKSAMPAAAKLKWVQCPCGTGPHDSEHLLRHTQKAIVEVRDCAVMLADICMRDNAQTRSQSAHSFAHSRTSWTTLSQSQWARASLGSTGTGMNWHTRSECTCCWGSKRLAAARASLDGDEHRGIVVCVNEAAFNDVLR